MKVANDRMSAMDSARASSEAAEFSECYENEFKQQIERAADSGKNSCRITGFGTRHLDHVAKTGFEKMGFIVKEIHDPECKIPCVCTVYTIEVIWRSRGRSDIF